MSEWTKVSDRWEWRNDGRQWVLREWTYGVSKKDGHTTRTHRETYHGRLSQVCAYIVDRTAGEANSVSGVIRAIERAAEEVRTALAASAA